MIINQTDIIRLTDDLSFQETKFLNLNEIDSKPLVIQSLYAHHSMFVIKKLVLDIT